MQDIYKIDEIEKADLMINATYL